MDKDMIKIDDLLQQRLGNAEEPERAGAWANMRELLDKQTPADKVPVAATNWRRMFAYVAGVALLAALSVGGYQVSQSFNSDESSGNIAGNIPSATTGLAGSAIEALPDTRRDNNNNTDTEEQLAESPQTATATAATSTPVETNQNNNTSTETSTASTASYNSTTNTVSSNKTLNTSNLEKVRPTTSNAGGVAVNTTSGSSNKPSAESNNSVQTVAKQQDNTVADNAKQIDNSKSSTQAGTDANSSNTDRNGDSKVSQPIAKIPTGDMKEAGNGAPEKGKFKEVPYQKIEVAERVGKNGIHHDTIFNGEDVMKVRQQDNNNIAAADIEKDDNASGDIMPAASAAKAKKERNSESVVMEKLGDHKVSSRKMKNYNPNRFEEMVKNAKYRMGAIKFYPGIVFGASGSFKGDFGIHAGLALNTSINDRWSILTEVKYNYRWNSSNENLQDDYISNVKSSVVNGQPITTYDSVEHYYNFTNYSSFELPIMLTYKTNRMRFMGGINLAYNLKITSLQEVENIHLAESNNISTNTGVFETDKKILLSDFSSSMSLGPVVGFGYKVSPAIRLDMRAAFPIWNSASTVGQKEIAKRLYNQPQMQLNLNYRFGSNRNKPYKRRR